MQMIDPSTIGVIVLSALFGVVEARSALRRHHPAKKKTARHHAKMKKSAAVIILWLGMAVPSHSAYFRFMDMRDGALHPAPLVGAFVDPATTGNSEGGGLLPIITHSARRNANGTIIDGCLLPSIVCEDWSPLAIGGSMNGGKMKLDIGPVFNILPIFQNAGTALIDLWGADKLPGLRAILRPTQAGDRFDARFSVAPVFEFDPLYQALPGNANGHGYFKLFVGPQLLF